MSDDILSCRFRNLFEERLSPARQHQAVDALKDYIAELKHGTNEQRRELGVLGDEDDEKEVVERKLHAALEKSYWQLVMFLRVSHLVTTPLDEQLSLSCISNSSDVSKYFLHAVEILTYMSLVFPPFPYIGGRPISAYTCWPRP